jgi:hypothetical protein
MRSTVICVLVAFAVVAGLPPSASSSGPRTRIYIGAREVGYVEGDGVEWYASWGDGVGAWVYRDGPRRFFAGCESDTDANRSGYARARTIREWLIATFPGFVRLGVVRFRSPTRWDIYNKRARLIGYTSGPDGVAAALAWLAVSRCR